MWALPWAVRVINTAFLKSLWRFYEKTNEFKLSTKHGIYVCCASKATVYFCMSAQNWIELVIRTFCVVMLLFSGHCSIAQASACGLRWLHPFLGFHFALHVVWAIGDKMRSLRIQHYIISCFAKVPCLPGLFLPDLHRLLKYIVYVRHLEYNQYCGLSG